MNDHRFTLYVFAEINYKRRKQLPELIFLMIMMIREIGVDGGMLFFRLLDFTKGCKKGKKKSWHEIIITR